MEKTFQEEFNKINLRFDKNESSHETLKSDVETLKSDVETLKSDVKTLKSDVKTLKSDVKTLKSDLNDFKTETKQNFADQRREMHMLHEDTKSFIYKLFQDFGTVQDHTPEIENTKDQLKNHEDRIQIIEKVLQNEPLTNH